MRHHPSPVTYIQSSLGDSRGQLQIFTAYSNLSFSIVKWNYPEFLPEQELLGHNDKISCMLSIPCNYLLSFSFDHSMIIWDLDEMKATFSIKSHKSPILAACYDQHTSTIFSGALDNQIIVAGLEYSRSEIVDYRVKRVVKGTGPVLSIGNLGYDRLISFENASLRIYDYRGILYKEIKINCLPAGFLMLEEDLGAIMDAEGIPRSFSVTGCLNLGEKRFGAGERIAGGSSLERASGLMALRMNGAFPVAQLLEERPYRIIASVNEKSDSLLINKIY